MLLAEDGIFPITKDDRGEILPLLPASGISIPGTIQGEGKLCGMPSLFLRVAGCNLHCCWKNEYGILSPCDTAYAAYNLRNTQEMSVKDIYNIITHNTENIRYLVITGGEPFLQHKELKELCIWLKKHKDYHITIETNATVFQEELAQYINLFSLSPKLSSSHLKTSATQPPYQIETIKQFINYAHTHNKEFQLKFVYSCPEDIIEINIIVSQLTNCNNEDILLMPLGGDVGMVRMNTMRVVEYCIRHGWRYCDRLHLSIFGNKKGI